MFPLRLFTRELSTWQFFFLNNTGGEIPTYYISSNRKCCILHKIWPVIPDWEYKVWIYIRREGGGRAAPGNLKCHHLNLALSFGMMWSKFHPQSPFCPWRTLSNGVPRESYLHLDGSRPNIIWAFSQHLSLVLLLNSNESSMSLQISKTETNYKPLTGNYSNAKKILPSYSNAKINK